MRKFTESIYERFDSINDLQLNYRNNPDSAEARDTLRGSLGRLASYVAIKFPTKYDPQDSATDLFVFMRNFAYEYKGKDFLKDLIESIVRKFW